MKKLLLALALISASQIMPLFRHYDDEGNYHYGLIGGAVDTALAPVRIAEGQPVYYNNRGYNKDGYNKRGRYNQRYDQRINNYVRD